MNDQPSHAEDSPTAVDSDRSSVPASSAADAGSTTSTTRAGDKPAESASAASKTGRFLRELVIIVAIALVASAVLRAFVVQAFFVPSGSMIPEIQRHDRILVSRIGEVDRGEVVVFEDPGGWIPQAEQSEPPGPVRQGLEWIGVLPATGHDHLVKRAIGLPGDHVACCDEDGRLTINGYPVDESDFLAAGGQIADNATYDVVVPADHMFVLGDNRYLSGDSTVHLPSQDAFVPLDLVTGRALAVVWPLDNAHRLGVPAAYDDVPAGRTPPEKGVVKSAPTLR